MKMNWTKTMLMFMMTMSTIMVMTSNKMFLSWMSMEINFFSFLPIMTKSKKMKDQTMKYFIIQSTSSSIMLMSILMNSTIENPLNSSILLTTSMLMKMGMMPFHLWLPSTMQSMTWENCMIISTWQKITPTILISQLSSMKTMMIPMSMTLLISPMSMMKQLSTKKIMAYSSITNSPWMIYSTMLSKNQFMYFFLTYSLLTIMIMKKMKKMNLMYINQIKSMNKIMKMEMLINMLSISGMPPMLGFFPKWMILCSASWNSPMMSIFMILSSMMSSFMYLKMISSILMNFSSSKKTTKKKKKSFLTIILNLLGIPMSISIKMIN